MLLTVNTKFKVVMVERSMSGLFLISVAGDAGQAMRDSYNNIAPILLCD